MVPLEESVTPFAGESLIRDLKLSALPPGVGTKMVGKPRAPAQGEFGSLSLCTDPWALARWGSVDLGETPFTDRRVMAGSQTLHITNPQFGIDEDVPVSVPRDKSVVVILRFEKTGAKSKLVQKIIR